MFAALTLIVNLAVLTISIKRWAELGVILWRSIWLAPFLAYLFTSIACAWLLLPLLRSKFPLRNNIEDAWQKVITWLQLKPGTLSRLVYGLLAAIVIFLIPILKFWLQIGQESKHSTQDPILAAVLFYWISWFLIISGSFFATRAINGNLWKGSLLFLLVTGVAFEIYYRLQNVNAYPFSLGWSESSRYFYASLFFAPRVYGQSFPLTVMHPSRYFLQSLAFLIPGNSLVFSRLWQAVLWVTLTAISAVVLPRRIFSRKSTLYQDKVLYWLLSAWIFLFLLRIGVYYHLEPILFLPFLVGASSPKWKQWLLLAIASVWAGISRVNWFVMPGFLLSLAYFFEVPLDQGKSKFRYWSTPAILSISGTAIALASQWLYIQFSGNATNSTAFASSFTSDLLWYRLLPNESFPLGILLATLIMTLPLVIVLATNMFGYSHSVRIERTLSVLAILSVILAGSLVVSVKIGGGGDLHNMDAFATVLLVAVLFSASDRFVMDTDTASSINHQPWANWPTVFMAAMLPVIFLIHAIRPPQNFNEKQDAKALQTLMSTVNELGKGSKVLFINERHLVTFGQVKVPLEYDYEAVTLMEMAMSGNQPYLDRFYQRIKNQEFSVIVSGKLNQGIKTSGVFFEENNVWNSRVSAKILCYYEPAVISTLPEITTMIEAEESKITVLVPKQTNGDCQ